jgi:dihydroorotate dehydrogenase
MKKGIKHDKYQYIKTLTNKAIEKLNAGASLVQLYTGFIYEGPALVKAINEKILENS